MHSHNMPKPLNAARCQQAGDVTGLTRIPPLQNINPGQSFVPDIPLADTHHGRGDIAPHGVA